MSRSPSVTSPPPPIGRRRGRPRSGEQAQRRGAALDAALDLLIADGADGTTMQAVAGRVGSSKESLYTWFGSRQGLLAALIERQSDRTNTAVAAALEQAADPRETLTGIATNLLTLLVGRPSVALNRAAMNNPELAALLLQHGRHTTGPLVEQYLTRLIREGVLAAEADPAETFQLFYGLVIRDWQIRVLLGEVPPDSRRVAAEARTAVDNLFALAGGTSGLAPG
ncbi:TetR/AcrR family transcriptional regulator [Nocardia mangyaensis]|uniref:TetR/AcrR family transcriptional regulator n=1 Tax=Nocardia mangyaensis TaxID=2213200 RepID=UPI002674DE65|nr:TetR family transcriptional regulator [Nocardia mangyaensis]MDO3650590.1 TetR family transcriptional regulator [Nocardia mangyaensis]